MRPKPPLLLDRAFDALTSPLVVSSENRWVRCSAQVWNELSDFEHVGKVILGMVEKLRDGSWKE